MSQRRAYSVSYERVLSKPDASTSTTIPLTPLPDPVADRVRQADLKICKLNLTNGEMIVLIKTPPGQTLAKHFHPGTVVVYVVQGEGPTMKGGWLYHDHCKRAGIEPRDDLTIG